MYKKFAVKKVKPGQQPFMSLDELNQIVVNCGLFEVFNLIKIILNLFNKILINFLI